LKVLVQVLRREGCSTEFQHRISRAVEAGLTEALDIPETAWNPAPRLAHHGVEAAETR